MILSSYVRIFLSLKTVLKNDIIKMFLSIDTIRRKLRIFLFLKPVSLLIELLRIWFIYSIEINVINIIY